MLIKYALQGEAFLPEGRTPEEVGRWRGMRRGGVSGNAAVVGGSAQAWLLKRVA